MSAAVDQTPNLAERRKFARKEVHIGANAIVASTDDAIDCTIRDISQSGAKLELANVDIIPARFKLFVPEIDYMHECEVVWRDGDFVGVQFTNGVSL